MTPIQPSKPPRKPRTTTSPELAAKINKAIADNPDLDRMGIVELLVESGETETGLYSKVSVRHPNHKQPGKASKIQPAYLTPVEDRIARILEDAKASLDDIDRDVERLMTRRAKLVDYINRNKVQ
jgi:hypothetical protein